MKSSARTPMIIAVFAAVVAALSACADIDRIGQPGTPYIMPSGVAVNSVYSASEDSSLPASFIKEQSRAAEKMQQQKAASFGAK